jgi:hypothetical protein
MMIAKQRQVKTQKKTHTHIYIYIHTRKRHLVARDTYKNKKSTEKVKRRAYD